MKEEWRHYGRDYQVSNMGRIRSVARPVRTKAANGRWSIREVGGRLMKQGLNSTGYMRVNIGGRVLLSHRVVAEAFLENYSDDLTVNHKDGNKTNNCIENLEMLTLGDNVRHAWRTGLCNSRRKIRCIDTGFVFGSLADASDFYGLARGNLVSAANGRQKTYAGRRWEYV